MSSKADKVKEQIEENSDDENTETEIVGEAVSPADSITDWGHLQPRQQTRHRWTVLNLKPDSENTAHYVDTRELDCSCRDHEYNRQDSDVCKHLAVALWAADRNIGTEELSRWSLQHELKNARETVEKIEHLGGYLEKVASGVDADAAGEAVENAPSGGESESTQQSDADAEEAADRLKSAFDEVLDDMQVQAHAGHVWFQTGRDTEDEWPFPGVDTTFDAITSSDLVEYVYENDDGPNHELYSEKPGEWWKNALDPDDVDEYISEVLE